MKLILSVLVLSLAAGTAGAISYDFDALPASTNLGGVPNNPASILTDDLSGIVFGLPGVSTGVAVVENTTGAFSDPNSISGLDAAGELTFALAGDMYFRFVIPGTATDGVTDAVSFWIGDDGGDLDSWRIVAYDLGGTVINTQSLSGTSHQLYSLATPGIHRISIFNTTGTTAGYGVDDLTFNAPTPEPASIALFGLGIAGLGVAIRRRRRAAA